jgi:hypothetical protein
MENVNDTIDDRTRGFPGYNAVPQPTASPRVRQINSPIQQLTSSDVTLAISCVRLKILFIWPVTLFRTVDSQRRFGSSDPRKTGTLTLNVPSHSEMSVTLPAVIG